MTTKTEHSISTWSRAPARITASYSSRAGGSGRRWSTRPSTVLIPALPKNSREDFQVPLEAVLEALDYVARNRPLIEQERDREAARLRARGLDGPAQG